MLGYYVGRRPRGLGLERVETFNLKGFVAEQEIDVLGLGGQVTAHQENV